MAEIVIDYFKIIDIEKHDRKAVVASFSTMREQLSKTGTIEEVGQRIVTGHELDFMFHLTCLLGTDKIGKGWNAERQSRA